MRAVIVGIGNTLRGDDGVGVHVAREAARRYPALAAVTAPGIDLDLLGPLGQADKAVVVDAVHSEQVDVGEVVQIDWDPGLPGTASPAGRHRLTLADLVQIARALGRPLPRRLTVLGVGVRGPFPVAERLSEPLLARLDPIVEAVAAVLDATRHCLK